MNSLGKRDYSLMDTSVGEPSFLQNISRLLLTVPMVSSATRLSLELTRSEIQATPSSMPTDPLSIPNGTAFLFPMIWLSWNSTLKSTGLNLETMLLLTAWPPLVTSLAKLLWYPDGAVLLTTPVESVMS